MTKAKARDDAQHQDAVVTHSDLHAGWSKDGYGVEAEAAFHKGPNVTVADASVQMSTANFGPRVTVLHVESATKIAGADVVVSGDVGSVNYGPGTHNKDGSRGIHLGGNATTGGGEVTVHKEGLGSVTAGVSGGLAADASIGGKKEGNTSEVCGRVSFLSYTVGACLPVWTGRN